MATEDQYLATRRGAGNVSRVGCRQHQTLTVAGNTTVKGQVTIPAGSHLRGISVNNATAITGTPTHTYLRAGATDGGQDYVADVDVKAAGNVATTIVTSIDLIAAFAAADTTIFYQLTTSGGTSSAGPVNVFCDYDAPRF